MFIFGNKWKFPFSAEVVIWSLNESALFTGIVRLIGYNWLSSTVGRHMTCILTQPLLDCRSLTHVFNFFFGPPCLVSTQWLSSSKWLARGVRRSRCVHFYAMHSQCLPKTVTWLISIWSAGNVLYHSCFSFFLSWGSKTQPNHWTKRMASTRLLRTQEPVPDQGTGALPSLWQTQADPLSSG